ncbi:MAG: COX15/CtaA family protein, partial [Gemmatimonadales bacterium]
MTEQPRDVERSYRRLAGTAAALAFGLIVLGGVVRITGSGLGCGDHWPRCHGEWFPPLDLPTLIEIGHRWVAALLSFFVLGLAGVAWRDHRDNPALRTPATLALVLLVVQILLGPVIVKLDLPPAVVVVHLLNAMVLLATLVIAALRTIPRETVGPWDRGTEGFSESVSRSPGPSVHRLASFTAGLGFVVILFGALVANLNAGLVCEGFPLCQGRWGPPASALGVIHWTHRI